MQDIELLLSKFDDICLEGSLISYVEDFIVPKLVSEGFNIDSIERYRCSKRDKLWIQYEVVVNNKTVIIRLYGRGTLAHPFQTLQVKIHKIF